MTINQHLLTIAKQHLASLIATNSPQLKPEDAELARTLAITTRIELKNQGYDPDNLQFQNGGKSAVRALFSGADVLIPAFNGSAPIVVAGADYLHELRSTFSSFPL